MQTVPARGLSEAGLVLPDRILDRGGGFASPHGPSGTSSSSAYIRGNSVVISPKRSARLTSRQRRCASVNSRGGDCVGRLSLRYSHQPATSARDRDLPRRAGYHRPPLPRCRTRPSRWPTPCSECRPDTAAQWLSDLADERVWRCLTRLDVPAWQHLPVLSVRARVFPVVRTGTPGLTRGSRKLRARWGFRRSCRHRTYARGGTTR